jgi:hypothetical protein
MHGQRAWAAERIQSRRFQENPITRKGSSIVTAFLIKLKLADRFIAHSASVPPG